MPSWTRPTPRAARTRRSPYAPIWQPSCPNWLRDRLSSLRSEAGAPGGQIPETLPPVAKLFDVPEKPSKVLNRDLKAAGIAKRDHRGRVLDVHSFRHTFITTPALDGVPVKLAKEMARHKRTEMTMNVCSHIGLADRAGALSALDSLKIVGLAGEPAETPCKPVHPDATPCQAQALVGVANDDGGSDENPGIKSKNGGSPDLDDPPIRARATGLEPATTGSTV